MKHGQITSDELQNLYKYRHTSRSIRDVRELGIPIEGFRVRGSDGRTNHLSHFCPVPCIER